MSRECLGGFLSVELDLLTYCCLVLELPAYPHPVLHEERTYPTVSAHVPPTSLSDIASNCVNEVDSSGTLEFTIQGRQAGRQAVQPGLAVCGGGLGPGCG